MNVRETVRESLQINQEQLLGLVRELIGRRGGNGGREGDEDPLPPGPWDPVIRLALERVWIHGPQPDPWTIGQQVSFRTQAFSSRNAERWRLALASILRMHPEIYDAIGGGQTLSDEVALNPQPLPPRYAFLIAVAQAVIHRAELFQEMADLTPHDGSQQGIIIVSGYSDRFTDDWCGTGWRLRYPVPGPRPDWFPEQLDGLDLLVLATQFDQGAKQAFSPDLRKHLAKASAKFAEAGVTRTQSFSGSAAYTSG